MNAVIEQISPHHPLARAILAEAAEASDGLYPPSSQHGLSIDEAASVTMLAAWVDGKIAGSGVIRPLDESVAEIKRLFVRPPFRKRGIARHLLVDLETLATTLGFRVVRLETGKLQPEAIALYQSSGYRPIEAFGEYANDPQSLCFEKCLVITDRSDS